MSVASDLAYLLISPSVDPDTTRRIDLVASTTCFGRPDSAARGFDFIDLELPNISRKHARIVHDGTGYNLENWQGRLGIGIYERRLDIGQSPALRHCDRFRIPDGDGPHIRLIFLLTDQTRYLPFEVEAQRPNMRIY